MEQQLAAGWGEGQVAELVEDDEVHAREIVGHAALPAGAGLGLELVGQIDDVEEAFAHEADLVLDLPLLPARGWRAGDGIDQVVAAHLQEAPVIGALLADEDRLHRRLHVVVDAARAGALEEDEAAIMGVENHLLALARIGPHQQHARMAEPQMGDLHLGRHAVDDDDLVAPVELVGLAGRKTQRNIGIGRDRRLFARQPLA